MDESRFDKFRRELYGIVQLEEYDTERFRENFFKLIQMCTTSLMDSDDNFFALFFMQMKREINFNLSEAIETKLQGTYFKMYFNPRIFLECTLKQMEELIKHEVYHIMSRHYLRAKALKNKYSDLAIKVAMDISINQYLMYLPPWSKSLENVRMEFNVELKEDETMEEYAAKIQEAIDKPRKKGKIEDWDFSNTHEIWDDMDNEINNDQADEIIKKIAGNSARGKIPESIDVLIKGMDKKPEITWSNYLRRMLGIVPQGHKKTVTRKNRRQPERLELKGKLPDRTAEIIIALDISGSITDMEIDYMMTEIFSIVKNSDFDITIIECDSEVRRVYKVKSRSQVKKKIDTRGGTKFSPVFQYVKDKRLKNKVIIFFTDGIGEKELSVDIRNNKVIWVLTGKEDDFSVNNAPGKIISLNKNTDKKETVNVYELIRGDMLHIKNEWAGK